MSAPKCPNMEVANLGPRDGTVPHGLQSRPCCRNQECHCPGDTCLLIPRVTLPYHALMTHSGHSPVEAQIIPHPSGSRPGQNVRLWRGEGIPSALVWPMARNGPKRPGMAPSAHKFSIWRTARFRATGASLIPSFSYETAPNGPKWRGYKKILKSGLNRKPRRQSGTCRLETAGFPSSDNFAPLSGIKMRLS